MGFWKIIGVGGGRDEGPYGIENVWVLKDREGVVEKVRGSSWAIKRAMRRYWESWKQKYR